MSPWRDAARACPGCSPGILLSRNSQRSHPAAEPRSGLRGPFKAHEGSSTRMGGRHAHPTGPALGAPRLILASVVAVLGVVIAAMVWLWPDTEPRHLPATATQQLSGTVTSIKAQPCPKAAQNKVANPGDQAVAVCGTVDIRLADGPEPGRGVTTKLPSGVGAPVVAVSDDVVVNYTAANPEDLRYALVDHQRGTQLWTLLAAFALAILAFGRWRGLTALAGLIITFAVVLMFVIPAILVGRPPMLVAIVGSAAIVLTVLYLTHGLSRATSVAVAGTLASLALTGLLSFVAVEATELSGVADETSSILGQLYGVNMRGLLLAGILIGSLGVLDDVTVTQAVTVQELAEANPDYRFSELYSAATRVGRAHIASVINTIILAYAGASLPLIVLITALNDPIGQVLSDQLVATELVRSAVGTIGLIAAVPITTALASLWAAHTADAQAQRG